MKQNKYDQPDFFSAYSQMPRSAKGLEAAGEWHAFQSMLPELHGKRVLDLGCGFGWHCRYAREQGASHVVGVDISEKMLERAKEMTNDDKIQYHRSSMESIKFKEGSFDVVISSLAFHYVQDIATLFEEIHRVLSPDGALVFSMEHPIFTSRADQDWTYNEAGEIRHWPVDHYQEEGIRHTSFLTNDVIKYHRTSATLINTLLSAGFQLKEIQEPQPTKEMMAAQPTMKEESRRPMFLLLSALK
ncbi:class I SAM-dependent methyltransferase [Aureibacillus halotolerans]|uniref:Ubiquinone/menaquinone biosynthesis C-methylase UbiE n=1 Tax=Aureibacillus halotolerans TaxID=1508390 RepID=A0A4R6U8F1_9BACI|nr:methyltransferase domain-containing protein [Aureibacillus halotolerans]TDQ42661.1 ubiquinone/menaquinone biosynthesis C-methylase UbiE [Aureibacillus halotolerans]